jgi:ABC-type glycerol-3-phosphate transport system substrate-binding protein
MLQKPLTYLKKPLAYILFLVLSGTLLLSGCSKNAVDGNSANGDQVTLKFISNAGQYKVDQYGYKRIQEFMKLNPNIKVEIIDIGNSFDDTFLSLAQTGDLPDVFDSDNRMPIQTLVVNKWIQPLDNLLTDLKRFPSDIFVEGINKLDGKIYSIPRIDPISSPLLVYNKQGSFEASRIGSGETACYMG